MLMEDEISFNEMKGLLDVVPGGRLDVNASP